MRTQVTIVQIRAADARHGDVVNRRGAERTGWVDVDRVEELPDGTRVLHDQAQHDDFTATATDLLWLQVLTPLEIDSQS